MKFHNPSRYETTPSNCDFERRTMERFCLARIQFGDALLDLVVPGRPDALVHFFSETRNKGIRERFLLLHRKRKSLFEQLGNLRCHLCHRYLTKLIPSFPRRLAALTSQDRGQECPRHTC